MCCPERYNDWFGDDMDWLYDQELKAVVFIDENIHHIHPTVLEDLDKSVKALIFPGSLSGCSDLNVLSSVINFVKAHRILITKGTYFYFATRDMGFKSRSESERQQRSLDFEIQYLFFKFKVKSHLSLSKKIVIRINQEIDQIQRYEDNMKSLEDD